MLKKTLKFVFIVLGIIVFLVAALLIWLSINEFNPEPTSDVKVEFNKNLADLSPHAGDTINIISWNIGYAGLGEKSDFFMDGGEEVQAADHDTLSSYLRGIFGTLYNEQNLSDIYMLQEVDSDSTRSYGIDEKEYLGMDNVMYAMNYSCPFVPYPLPPIGRVNSGLMTSTVYNVDKAVRISLPCPFNWPVSTANLKRCLLVSYIPIEEIDKKLVIVNLHLEAYDDGDGAIAQTKKLRDFIYDEYRKGNYVIAGGDFNQVFPGGSDKYPNKHADLWSIGLLSPDILPPDWYFAYDTSTPTCRLLNQPYDPKDTENTQYHIIDGFMISPNLELISVETLDEGFVNSDHNPVKLQVKLK